MIIILIFASNINAMTQPIADKYDTQILSFKDFVDSVFTELNHWETEYSYFDCKDLANWKNTLIPLAVNLYELAQTNDAVFWWLLQLMSHVDVCKDRKEDLRKSDVFAMFSKLKQRHQKIILEKCLPTCAEELQKALENDEKDAFKSILPVIDENDAFYSIGRLLKRVEEIREIYEKTISHTKGDSLGRLFVLFRRYYEYFANSYDNNHRSCDGMAKNIFLALYQTQYRDDNNEFCEVTHEIGELWVRGLVLTYHNYNTQMPPVASVIVLDTLQKQYEEFHRALSNCLSEKQIVSLMEEYGGWLELEEYDFIYNVLQVSKEVRSDTTPPFSCLCTDKKKKRKRITGNVEHRDNREKIHYKDNYIPYIESINAIPMEEFETLKAQEANKNVEIHEPLVVSDCNPKQAAIDKAHEAKDKTVKSNNKFKPMYFPDDWEIPIDKRVEFLKTLHQKFLDHRWVRKDSLEDFIFIFGGYEAVTMDNYSKYKPVDWGKGATDDRVQLQAFCIAFYKMRMDKNARKQPPWAKLTPLFTMNGEPISALSTNASKVFKEEGLINDMTERISDARNKVLDQN